MSDSGKKQKCSKTQAMKEEQEEVERKRKQNWIVYEICAWTE